MIKNEDACFRLVEMAIYDCFKDPIELPKIQLQYGLSRKIYSKANKKHIRKILDDRIKFANKKGDLLEAFYVEKGDLNSKITFEQFRESIINKQKEYEKKYDL